MKTKLLTIAMTAALMLAMTKVQAQNFEGPCLPSMHGLDDHQSAFCGSTLTQTIDLVSGTNWMSFNVDITLGDLQNALVDAMTASNPDITIKSQSQNVRYQRGRWIGQLATLNLAQMYLITVSEACQISVEGMPVDPSDLSIDINANGNTWIAFPFSANMTVTDFFGSFPINNDQAKSQFQNARYQRGRWIGQLTTLEPGKGYIYVSEDANDRVFTFPTNSK